MTIKAKTKSVALASPLKRKYTKRSTDAIATPKRKYTKRDVSGPPRERVASVNVEPNTIERGVPLATIQRRRDAVKYPFDQLQVGDSFVFPSEVNITVARSSASYFAKRDNKRFAIRTLDTNVIRCWRVA